MQRLEEAMPERDATPLLSNTHLTEPAELASNTVEEEGRQDRLTA